MPNLLEVLNLGSKPAPTLFYFAARFREGGMKIGGSHAETLEESRARSCRSPHSGSRRVPPLVAKKEKEKKGASLCSVAVEGSEGPAPKC